jgi:hypothetical protein
VADDGSEGLSPDGWLPDRGSVGVLTRVFTPELVDEAVDSAGALYRLGDDPIVLGRPTA